MVARADALTKALSKRLPESVFILRHRRLDFHGMYVENGLHGLIVCSDATTAMLLLADLDAPNMVVRSVPLDEACLIARSKKVRYLMHFAPCADEPEVVPVDAGDECPLET